MGRDLAREVGSCFSEAMRPVRNAATHRLAGPGAGNACLGRRAPFGILILLSSKLGSDLKGGLTDPLSSVRSSWKSRGDSITVIATDPSRIFGCVDVFGVSDHARDLLPQPVLTTVGVHGRVRRDLGCVDGHGAEPAESGASCHQQHLLEQAGERVLALDAEPRDRAMVRDVLSTQHSERHIGRAQPLDLTRGADATAVGIDEKAEQHLRVIPSSADPTPATTPIEIARIKNLDCVQQEPHQVIGGQPLPHVRRQQKRLIPQHRSIRLRHEPLSQDRPQTPIDDTHSATGSIVEEWDELSPGVVPEPDHGRVAGPPFLGQIVERGSGGGGVDRGVDRLQIALELVPVAAGSRNVCCGSDVPPVTSVTADTPTAQPHVRHPLRACLMWIVF